MVEQLPDMCEALALTPSTRKTKTMKTYQIANNGLLTPREERRESSHLEALQDPVGLLV